MARFRPEHLGVIGESPCGNGGTEASAGRCTSKGSSLQQTVSSPPAQVTSSKRNGSPIGLTVFCVAVIVPVFLTIFSASTGSWMRLESSYQVAIPLQFFRSKSSVMIGESDSTNMPEAKTMDEEVRSPNLNRNPRKGEELQRTEAEKGDRDHSPFSPPPPPPLPPHSAAADGNHGLIALERGPNRAAQRLLIITATESRPFQAAHLTQLANALRLAPPPLIWIVVECGKVSMATATVLSHIAGPSVFDGSTLDYRHISTESVENSRSKCLDLTVERQRVLQRNTGLEYIQARGLQGIVYVADEDNIYDPYVFHVLKEVREVGIIPIGILGIQRSVFIEHPLVRIMEDDDDKTTPSGGADAIAMETAAAGGAGGGGGRRKRRQRIVVGWHSEKWDYRKSKKKYRRWTSMGGTKFDFPVDLGAIVFNSKFLWLEPDPETQRPMKPVRLFEVGRGQSMETEFVNRLVVNASCLEPLGGRWEEGEKEVGGGGGGLTDEVLVWRRHHEALHGQAYPVLWSGDHILPPPRPLTVPLDPHYRMTVEMKRREAKGVNDSVAFTITKAPSQQPAAVKEALPQQPAAIKEAPSQQAAAVAKTGSRTGKE